MCAFLNCSWKLIIVMDTPGKVSVIVPLTYERCRVVMKSIFLIQLAIVTALQRSVIGCRYSNIICVLSTCRHSLLYPMLSLLRFATMTGPALSAPSAYLWHPTDRQSMFCEAYLRFWYAIAIRKLFGHNDYQFYEKCALHNDTYFNYLGFTANFLIPHSIAQSNFMVVRSGKRR